MSGISISTLRGMSEKDVVGQFKISRLFDEYLYMSRAILKKLLTNISKVKITHFYLKDFKKDWNFAIGLQLMQLPYFNNIFSEIMSRTQTGRVGKNYGNP